MRLAAISDIHGNCLALEAVLADIADQGIDAIVNLGDHLSGPLEARRTADLLIERNLPSIRGNTDRTMIETAAGQQGLSDRTAGAQLQAHQRRWLASLPPTLVFRDEVLLCHGTPRSDTDTWLERVRSDGIVHLAPIEAIERDAEGFPFPLMLCGHTHIPRAVRLRDGRLVVNPGSVGLPGYDHDVPVPHLMQSGTPDASYAILERKDGHWRCSFRQVPYDHAAMAAMAHAANRPDWASALATGWVR